MLTLQGLLTLGLTETEARVYLELAELGRTNPQIISKKTNIARTTVYWALDGLVAKGLASIERKKTTTFYSINQPQALVRMVKDQFQKVADELKEKEQIAQQLVSSIHPLIKGFGSLIPTVQFFDGQKGVNSMLHDYLPIWQENIARYDFTWWGYQDHTFVENYLEWIELTWREKKDGELYKVITNQSEVEDFLKMKAPIERVRFVPPEYNFSSTIWVLGDYIVLIMSNQTPHYALQFQNQAFAANLRTVFKMLWEIAL